MLGVTNHNKQNIRFLLNTANYLLCNGVSNSMADNVQFNFVVVNYHNFLFYTVPMKTLLNA